MRHLPILLLTAALLMGGSSCNLFKQSTSTAPEPAQYSTKSGVEAQRDYILNFKNAALLEMERGGVPASIILAQGLLESGAGQSELAREANNHFGVKCGGTWKGKTYKKKDDDRDANGNLIESCFRKYDNVSDSYYDHGEFLRDPKKANRYGFLFNLDRTDYKGWARGLQSAGYATAPDYADKLINLIERYQLYEYDRGNSPIEQPRPAPVKPSEPGQTTGTTSPSAGNTGPQLQPLQRIGRVNDVKVVLSKPGESLDEIARLYRLNVNKVVDFNERHYPPGFKLKENTRIFIQEKRSKWHGRAAEHFVQEGQTMFDVSQQYGVCLDKLLSRNNLKPNEQPAIGERVILKGTRKKSDVVRLRDTSEEPKTDNWNNQPSNTGTVKPATTTGNGKMTTDDDVLFEIEGNTNNQPANPSTTGQPTDWPTTGRPATSDGNPVRPAEPTPQPNNNRPPNNTWQPANPSTPPAQQQVPPGYHLVQKGETLYAISRKYNNIPVPKLKQLNNLKNDNIQAGQMLRVQ